MFSNDGKNDNKRTVRGCSKIVIFIAGLSFLGLAASLLLDVIFKGDSFIKNATEDVADLRFAFWLTLIAIAVYFLAGGKVFTSKDDEDDLD